MQVLGLFSFQNLVTFTESERPLRLWHWFEYFVFTVGTESIRTAERISRENAFFKTLPKLDFSVEFNKIFLKG
jgi:hypothetical protein